MSILDANQVARERRQHPRIEVLNPAKILMPGHESPMVCLVVDWSLGGARLRPYEPERCPDHFQLHTQDGGESLCEVVWRRDGQLGVKFLNDD
jgi:hypothetical protein